MKKLFDVPDSYKEHIAMFDIIDAFLALGIIVAYFVVLVLLCLKIRHQGIETIGLKEGNIRLSFVLGGLLAAILFFCNCLSNVLFEHQSFIDFVDILIYFIYFFTVGLVLQIISNKNNDIVI